MSTTPKPTARHRSRRTFRVADLTRSVVHRAPSPGPVADWPPRPKWHTGRRAFLAPLLVAALTVLAALWFPGLAFAGGALGVAAVSRGGRSKPRPPAKVEENAAAELNDEPDAMCGHNGFSTAGEAAAAAQKAVETTGELVVVTDTAPAVASVSVTCPYGCGWSDTFPDQADADTALSVHKAYCDKAPKRGTDVAEHGGRQLGDEGEGGQPVVEERGRAAPTGDDGPSRPPSPTEPDPWAVELVRAMLAGRPCDDDGAPPIVATAPAESSVLDAIAAAEVETRTIVLDRPTLPAPLERLLHYPVTRDEAAPLGTLLLAPPGLVDGRWTLDPYLFRADTLALLIVAQHLGERRFEAWYDATAEHWHLRAYGLLGGQPVVVRATTHRDVLAGATGIVAEATLATIAEQEQADLDADGSAWAALDLAGAEWTQAAETMLLANGAQA